MKIPGTNKLVQLYSSLPVVLLEALLLHPLVLVLLARLFQGRSQHEDCSWGFEHGLAAAVGPVFKQCLDFRLF